MDDPTRPFGFFLIGLTLLLAACAIFHEPPKAPAPPISMPAYCFDAVDQLFAPCAEPWMKKEIGV